MYYTCTWKMHSRGSRLIIHCTLKGNLNNSQLKDFTNKLISVTNRSFSNTLERPITWSSFRIFQTREFSQVFFCNFLESFVFWEKCARTQISSQNGLKRHVRWRIWSNKVDFFQLKNLTSSDEGLDKTQTNSGQ